MDGTRAGPLAVPSRIVACVNLACALEVSAPKPGNITPAAPFADASHADMLRSAFAIAPVMGDAGDRSVGELIEASVAATAAVVPANTNLGIVLLFAPLARAWALRRRGETLGEALEAVLAGLSVADADAAFRAIAAAHPGGLGGVAEHDVREPARIDLRAAMVAAADRDAVAAEYANGFEVVLGVGLPELREALLAGRSTLDAIVAVYLSLLARSPDTLIARKLGVAAARAVSDDARRVLDGTLDVGDFDASLRSPGNERNPGTTADLTAAVLFAALAEGLALP